MENNKFENRVFGAVLVKSVVANYNADFTGSPRTLPNSVVYATDKALKYCIRNYLKGDNKNIIFYTTRYKRENMQPLDIDETYIELFGEYPKTVNDFSEPVSKKDNRLKWQKYKDDNFSDYEIEKETENFVILKRNDKKVILIDSDDKKRKIVLENLFKAIDIRLFGATYASQEKVKINGKEQKVTFSIHGNVQITHGINIYHENNIFTEDITSPFRNSNERSDDSQQTTIGNQTVLEEGHYLHNFTINPKNSEELIKLIDNKGYLIIDDITQFKEAINRGVSYLDSASKIGVENEFSIFVTLNKNERIQLPSFSTLIKIEAQLDSLKRKLDLSEVKTLLNEEGIEDKIKSVEIYIDATKLDYDKEIFDIPKVCVKSIISYKELKNVKSR